MRAIRAVSIRLLTISLLAVVSVSCMKSTSLPRRYSFVEMSVIQAPKVPSVLFVTNTCSNTLSVLELDHETGKTTEKQLIELKSGLNPIDVVRFGNELVVAFGGKELTKTDIAEGRAIGFLKIENGVVVEQLERKLEIKEAVSKLAVSADGQYIFGAGKYRMGLVMLRRDSESGNVEVVPGSPFFKFFVGADRAHSAYNVVLDPIGGKFGWITYDAPLDKKTGTRSHLLMPFHLCPAPEPSGKKFTSREIAAMKADLYNCNEFSQEDQPKFGEVVRLDDTVGGITFDPNGYYLFATLHHGQRIKRFLIDYDNGNLIPEPEVTPMPGAPVSALSSGEGLSTFATNFNTKTAFLQRPNQWTGLAYSAMSNHPVTVGHPFRIDEEGQVFESEESLRQGIPLKPFLTALNADPTGKFIFALNTGKPANKNDAKSKIMDGTMSVYRRTAEGFEPVETRPLGCHPSSLTY